MSSGSVMVSDGSCHWLMEIGIGIVIELSILLPHNQDRGRAKLGEGRRVGG